MFRHFFEFGSEPHPHLFEKGDLKYVILDQLKDKPAHGYEIIRALEERCHGFYSPSAGSVYPTLQLLEDLGYVSSSAQDGKKIYTITSEGKEFLKQQEETINKIKNHMKGWWGFEYHREFHDIFHELRGIGRKVGQRAQRLEPEKVTRIKEVISKACHEIEAILEEK